MKILVCSDTHGSQGYIAKILAVAKEENPSLCIHLGDDYVDAQCFIDAGFPTIRVPGTWKSQYQNPHIDNRRFEDINGWRFFLSHTPRKHYRDMPDDIDPQQVIVDKSADIIMHGHTHIPIIDRSQDPYIINPGHLKEGDNRGHPHSYALLNINPESINVEIIAIDSKRVIEQAVLAKR